MGTYRRASRLVELIGDIPIGSISEEVVDGLIKFLGVSGIEGSGKLSNTKKRLD